jgi:hypothetical protein
MFPLGADGGKVGANCGSTLELMELTKLHFARSSAAEAMLHGIEWPLLGTFYAIRGAERTEFGVNSMARFRPISLGK